MSTAYALFAHSLPGEDGSAAGTIAEALAAHGIAVSFPNTTATADDLVAAAGELRGAGRAPALLIGHGFAGPVVLAAAALIPEVTAVATIGAPADSGAVAIPGRALLVLHAPTDDVVSVDNAGQIFAAARHPKSFVSLDDADHLLSHPRDAQYAADVIAAWASRYLPEPQAAGTAEAAGQVVVTETGRSALQQTITVGPHRLLADEPIDLGGENTGPSPYDLLLAALGACTSMTLRLYAERKKLPLQQVRVALRHKKIHAEDCRTCETKQGQIDHIERVITLTGYLDDAQRTRLLEIANKCPVHRTLTSEVDIRTQLTP